MPSNPKPATLRGRCASRAFSARPISRNRLLTVHDALPDHSTDSRVVSFQVPPELHAPADKSLALADPEHDNRITILVADDHPVVREGLVSLIERQSDMRVIAEASNGREAVEQFFNAMPDLVLMDLRMAIMDGVEAVISICEADLSARIAVITSYQDEEDVYRVLQAGARGYVLKDAPVNELVECVRAVYQGKTWVPPQVGAKLARRVADQALTPREVQVLNLVVSGKSNKEIGVNLDISQATVKVHMTHILEKLKVTGRTEAIGTALKRGLVRLELTPAA